MQYNLAQGIQDTAASLRIDPVDLATAISYETAGTFDPVKSGPTTKYGTHRGLIQFGEPQAKKYGVDFNDPIASQLGEGKAVARYLQDAGVKEGMGLMDIYSAINTGQVGRYGARDAAAGGMPGTVADKVNTQMGDHRANAQKFLASNTISDDDWLSGFGFDQKPQKQALPDVSDDDWLSGFNNISQQPIQELQATQPQEEKGFLERTSDFFSFGPEAMERYRQSIKDDDRSFIDKAGDMPFVAGLLDQVVGAGQMASNVSSVGADEINQFVTERENELDKHLLKDSWFYRNTGLSPERIAGNIMGSPAGLVVKGAGLLQKIGVPVANFAMNLFTAPAKVEEGQTFTGEKSKQAAGMLLFMGAIAGGTKGITALKDNLFKSDDISSILQGLGLPDDLQRNPAVIETLRTLKKNESALKAAKNADEVLDLFKKYGIDAELNDALQGAVPAQAAQARTTLATLDPKRVRDFDIRKSEQLEGAMQQMRSDFADGGLTPSKSEVGQQIRDEMQAYVQGQKDKIRDVTSPLYEQGKYQDPTMQKVWSKDKILSETVPDPQSRFKLVDEAILEDDYIRELSENMGKKYKNLLSKDAPLNSVERLHLVRQELDDEIEIALGKGRKTKAVDLQITRSKIDDALKGASPEFKQADVLERGMQEQAEGMAFEGITKITGKKDDNLASLSNQLFNQSLDTRQFKEITSKLTQKTRKDLMNVYLDDLTRKYTADTSMRRLFKDTQEQNKFMMLLKGDPNAKKKMQSLKDIDKIVKAIQSSREVMAGSATLNKQVATKVQDMHSLPGKLIKGVVNGSAREIKDAIVGATVGSAPIVNELMLNMDSKMQKSFYDFIINPKNVSKFVKVLNRLDDVKDFKTRAQLKEYLKKSGLEFIPGANRLINTERFMNAVAPKIGVQAGKEIGRK